VALAEQSVSAPQHTPLIYSEIATTSMTTKNFSKYAFRIRPNTVSGARAAAKYVKRITKQRPLSVYSVSPDYSYGHELTAKFLGALKNDGVQYKVAGQQYPQLGSTSFTNDITAVNSVSPDLLFLGIYGGDWQNFVKQARRTSTFSKTTSVQLCNMSSLKTLKAAAPTGGICFEFAPPPYLVKTSTMKQFVQSFKKQYKALPNDEQTLAYESVQAWAQAVKKAKSFGGTKVSQTLSGLTVHGVASTFTVRPCDHQATLPVYAGTIGKKVSQRWHQKLLTNVRAIPASKTLAPCGNNHGNGS
jgi:branched-chain amino acid transport system substrate-binding protein